VAGPDRIRHLHTAAADHRTAVADPHTVAAVEEDDRTRLDHLAADIHPAGLHTVEAAGHHSLHLARHTDHLEGHLEDRRNHLMEARLHQDDSCGSHPCCRMRGLWSRGAA